MHSSDPLLIASAQAARVCRSRQHVPTVAHEALAKRVCAAPAAARALVISRRLAEHAVKQVAARLRAGHTHDGAQHGVPQSTEQSARPRGGHLRSVRALRAHSRRACRAHRAPRAGKGRVLHECHDCCGRSVTSLRHGEIVRAQWPLPDSVISVQRRCLGGTACVEKYDAVSGGMAGGNFGKTRESDSDEKREACATRGGCEF